MEQDLQEEAEAPEQVEEEDSEHQESADVLAAATKPQK
jgi:hypothetical protein